MLYLVSTDETDEKTTLDNNMFLIVEAQEEKDLAEAIANRFENSILSEDTNIDETYFHIRPVGEEFGYVINVISKYEGERI